MDSVKKYKFDVNLEEIFDTKKGGALICSMMKNEIVECRFKNAPTNSNLMQKTSNQQQLSSSKSLIANPKNNSTDPTVEITFSPNNLVFNNTKGKSQYSDVLMIQTKKNFFSC